MTHFDTSAVISLIDVSQKHHSWAVQQYTKFHDLGPVIMNDMVYAELSAGMARKDDVDDVVSRFGFERVSFRGEALFLAGQRFKLHRDNGGKKCNVLPDYLIGAAACVAGSPLVTGNPRDFLSFFTGLMVISPSGVATVS